MGREREHAFPEQGAWLEPRPHPEEARSAVSKDEGGHLTMRVVSL